MQQDPFAPRALRPGDSLTIPKMALSISFTKFGSSSRVIQVTGFLTVTPVGLTGVSGTIPSLRQIDD